MYRLVVALVLALAGVLTLAGGSSAVARTHHRGAPRLPYRSYAQDYADYHSSLPGRPRHWYRGDFRTNTYPTCAPGVGGCVDDLGYGRVGSGVCN